MAVISIENYAYFIGGRCKYYDRRSDEVNEIMRYEIDRWTQIGRVLTSRRRHSAILNNDKIFIIGGIEYHKIRHGDNSTLGT